MTIKERLDELKAQIDKLDQERKTLELAWTDDVKKTISEPKFDIYSKKADKILEKVADKYTPLIVDIEDQRIELVEEYNYLVDRLKKLEAEEKLKKNEEND